MSGKYCQCTNFGCDYHKGEVCGGGTFRFLFILTKRYCNINQMQVPKDFCFIIKPDQTFYFVWTELEFFFKSLKNAELDPC